MPKEKQINDCYSSFGNIVCDRWVLRAHTAAHDVAMALRSSGIDARTYLCRVLLDHIDVRNVERTHTRETHGSRFQNNAHVLYRKCLVIVRVKYSARTYRSEWKLHALPPPRFIMRSWLTIGSVGLSLPSSIRFNTVPVLMKSTQMQTLGVINAAQ